MKLRKQSSKSDVDCADCDKSDGEVLAHQTLGALRAIRMELDEIVWLLLLVAAICLATFYVLIFALDEG